METIKIGSSNLRLFTDYQIAALKTNGLLFSESHNAEPCVFLKGKHKSFLISEICMGMEDSLYGLYIENGTPVLGFINLEKLLEYHDNVDFLFNDEKYEAHYKIETFKSVAMEFGKLVFDDIMFQEYFEKYEANS